MSESVTPHQTLVLTSAWLFARLPTSLHQKNPDLAPRKDRKKGSSFKTKNA